MMRRSFRRSGPVGRVRRILGSVVLAVAAVAVLATPASAGSVADPDDVPGRLDIRWLGAVFVAEDDTTRLTMSFHEGFRTSALPTIERGGLYPTFRGRGSLWVTMTEYFSGAFAQRRDGRLIFVYADWGSSCCNIERVHTPSARALRVTFPSIRDGADPTYEVHAESTWKRHDDVFTDLTATIDLGAPPEP